MTLGSIQQISNVIRKDPTSISRLYDRAKQLLRLQETAAQIAKTKSALAV